MFWRFNDCHFRFAFQYGACFGTEHETAMFGVAQRVAKQQRAGYRLDQRRIIFADDIEYGELVMAA